jgi:hypothetical protein
MWVTLDVEKWMLSDVLTEGGVNGNGTEHSPILNINDE